LAHHTVMWWESYT